jgi:hypothetical protein
MGCLVQVEHLSCTDTNSISKESKMRFHMTHIVLQFHQVRPKQFLSLWYIRRKPRTYLAPTLTLSPSAPKLDFI